MPADRPLLLAFVRVRNPDPEPKPLYWWTNIADRRETGRPGPGPGGSGLANRLRRVDRRRSRPVRRRPDHRRQLPVVVAASRGLLLRVPADGRPWIAAVEADGSGVVQTSTSALRGRKLFCWGTAAGGQRWQEWLCGPGRRYLEIQAGLATTQLEHLRLDGNGEISWVEAYAPLEADPEAMHGAWPDAVAEVAERMRTGRSPTPSSTNGTAGGARSWPRRHRSSWRPAGRRDGGACGPREGSRQPAGHPVRTSHRRRIPSPRRAGPQRRGRPGRRGRGDPGAPDQ